LERPLIPAFLDEPRNEVLVRCQQSFAENTGELHGHMRYGHRRVDRVVARALGRQYTRERLLWQQRERVQYRIRGTLADLPCSSCLRTHAPPSPDRLRTTSKTRIRRPPSWWSGSTRAVT